jgi:hypothetical protein
MKSRFAMVLVCAAGVASRAFAQGCPTSPATPLSPINTNVAVGNVAFNWSASPASGVTGYEVYAGTTTANTTKVCSTNGATSCTGSLSTAGSYGWLVRTKFTTCPSIDSPIKNFTAGCPQSGPTLTFPAANAKDISQTPQLQWNAVVDADKYDVYLGEVGKGCSAAPVNTTNGTTSQITTTLLAGTTYEWRVGARRGTSNCPVQFSSCQTFTTVTSCPAAGAFNNVSPADASALISTPTLTWSPSSGATQYFVHLGQVNPPPLVSNTAVTTTSFTPSTLGPGRYYWYVTALPSCGAAGKQESKVFSFSISACPGAATLEAPDDNASVTALVKFDWEPVAGATEYRLNAILSGGTNTTLLTTTKDTEYTATMPTGVTEWWVDTVNGTTCPTTSSTHRKFTVTGCPFTPPFPSLVSPADGATGLNSPVAFQWTGVAGATGYRVYGSMTAGDLFFIGATTGATQLTAAVPKGTINWLVEARFGDCPSGFSRSFTMTVANGAACSTTGTTLVSPANNATGVATPAEFKWTKIDGAIGYNLYVNNELQGFTTDTSMTRLVADGKNSWRVDTLYAGCPAARSADFVFTAGTPDVSCGSAVAVTAPAAGAAVTSPVTMTWTPSNGATAYRVYASLDGGPAELLARTTETTVTLPLPSGTIEAFVEALYRDCVSTFSPHVTFTVNKAATCDAHRPATLTSPIGGANTNAEVEFKWTATDAAALYRVWVSMNGAPFESIGVTTDTQLERRLEPGKGTWFVESIFAGCPALASNKETFTIPTTPRCVVTPPMLVSPADNAQNVTSPVAFVWSAVPETDDYRVFISLNNGQFIQIADTDDVTSITRSLPSGVYRWFVEAVLEGCPGVRSAISRFTIQRAQNCPADAPQLLTPANGASLTDTLVTLSWSPVSGAIGYVVFARAGDGPFTRIEETPNRSVTRPFIDNILFEWYVVTLLNGCPSVESQHSTFRIEIAGLDACAKASPILHSPPDHAVGVTSPVRFIWTQVPGVTQYKVWAAIGEGEPSIIGTTTDNKLTANVPAGVVIWFVEGDFVVCPPVRSAPSTFTALKSPPPCAPPERTRAHAPGQVASGSVYSVRWAPVANASSYEIQESLTADFGQPSAGITEELYANYHSATATLQKRYYRVRAISSCLDVRGPFSPVVTVVILPDSAHQSVSFEAGSPSVAQKVFIPGKNPPVTFTASTDKPWAHVTPASGTIGPAGITLIVTYDDAALKLGTNTASVIVSYPNIAGKMGVNDVAPKTSVPVSVSTVTPVGSGGKSGPPQNAMIIPVIGHAAGVNSSLFESDVRIANTAATTQKFQLNFTLSGTDGTQSGQSTTIQVLPGETMALDDILTSFFGIGADGSSATGVLEIRPLTSSTSITSTSSTNIQTAVASSRTYNSTSTGTFGQYIPAILFSQFIGKDSGRLTLQQVAQSAVYRTNLGLTEGAGEPASVNVHVFDAAGSEVANIPVSLLAGEHKQLNSFLATNNISLEEGRFEIEVTSATGKVTAYASTVDNATGDPLCVFPVLKGAVSASRFVIPGVADLNSPFYSWRSDIRVFNSGTSDVTATLTYYPQTGNATASGPTQIVIKAGEVKAIDNALSSLYGLTNSGGALAITTASASPLVVTARTYNQTANGTFGQFIPAVTPADAVGLNERTLQLLQLEQSDRFRSNIGLDEVSGSPATAEVSVIVPDSKFAIKAQIPLAANEFRQLNLGTDFGVTNAYNVRVTVKVISGTGRVTAYGSMIDQITQDPTYDPPL